jgi:serine/threonine-protein kinase
MAHEFAGHYRIGRTRAATRFYILYEGTDDALKRSTLIRIIPPEYAAEPTFIKRFLSEALTANTIDHPGFIPISENGQLRDGSAYLVYEAHEGESLQTRCKRAHGPLPLDLVLRLSKQIAGALAAAHARGLVHRDLRPEHIMLVPDPDVPGGERAKLLDFGITNFAERWQALQTAKDSDLIAITGSPSYMSPEQCRGSERIDDKTDVYSMGVILYQMLAGRLPFQGEGYGEFIGQHLYREVPHLSTLVSGVPADVQALVELLLLKRAEQRPTMAQVTTALERLSAKYPGSVPEEKGAAIDLSLVNPLAPTGTWSLTFSALRSLLSRPTVISWRRAWPSHLAIGLTLLFGYALTRLLLHPTPPDAAASTETKQPPTLLKAPPPSLDLAGPPLVPVAAPPRIVYWELQSQPLAATVSRRGDGKILGRTPCRIEQAAATGLETLVLRKEGYEESRIIVDRSENTSQEITLTKVAQAVKAPKPPPHLQPAPVAPRQTSPTALAAPGRYPLPVLRP